MGQLVALLEHEILDEATRLAAEEAITELAETVSGDAIDDDALTDQQIAATKRLRRLAPQAWEFLKPALQSLLTSAAKQELNLP